ncbi:MAG TPA: cob(I)yrinic acid a,c-diamide adenosyltransferase [Methylomusa anaerophila]|uniref:Corrinoid adenosyltransferase n=1 Tax=Methylomusa anaerophila TaxID=1930071 RepID=A0A348AG72_9FIRM|nr:cob(I)yrinic acid a,c-diamide adenosyltransferase [Methylomusa anaerophila]BBB90070.1 Cob(I)yrinic acid a,c-diamide adenosyltransferase [Methylomusa anaerophila]HML88204.1 cob(I)yrinic acid a,c-diamide adenosyltransferase [Methylomusa anaerophila]
MIYTKTGDKGTTSLLDGTRVRKNSPRVESYGTIDELNSLLGFGKHFIHNKDIVEKIHTVQKELFSVASALADPQGKTYTSPLGEAEIVRFETWIDEYVKLMNPAPKFIVPGSCQASGILHVARTVCRRAERVMTALDELEPVNPILAKYINRLSDVLYTFARYLEENQELVNT